MTSGEAVRGFQEAGHGPGHDYEAGSPHLKHDELRGWIAAGLADLVASVRRPGRRPRVLEVGAGHGTFTDHLVAAGADVVVTEMSSHSAAVLAARFADCESVDVVHDPRGELEVDGEVDAVIYISVLHHIPDYATAVRRAIRLVRTGGAFASFQDPLWYERLSRRSRAASRAFYLAWRLGQGHLGRGLATTLRRARGVYDESTPSDMVEYHVVRDGVDEALLVALLGESFASVDLMPYWSTQSALGQTLGRRLVQPNTFALVATHRS